jgi:hypothetical protein
MADSRPGGNVRQIFHFVAVGFLEEAGDEEPLEDSGQTTAGLHFGGERDAGLTTVAMGFDGKGRYRFCVEVRLDENTARLRFGDGAAKALGPAEGGHFELHNRPRTLTARLQFVRMKGGLRQDAWMADPVVGEDGVDARRGSGDDRGFRDVVGGRATFFVK